MSANKPILERNYDFSDAVLEQFADVTAANLTRDMAALATRGITAATVTALEGLRSALTDAPSDIEARAVVGEASEDKEAARDAALVEARRLRTAAQNVFGEDSAKYRRFGYTGMDALSDAELRNALYRFHRVGVLVQALLAAEGIDAAFLAAFLSAILAYDDALDSVKLAEESRDAQTEDRVNKGNTLYKEIVRLCNIGKDVFAPVSEATYNDYVIENFVGTGNGDTLLQTIQNTIAPDASNSEGPLPAGASSMKVTNLAGGPLEFGLSTAGLVFNGNTATLGAPGSQTYDISYFASAGNIILVRNQNSALPGEYKIEIFG